MNKKTIENINQADQSTESSQEKILSQEYDNAREQIKRAEKAGDEAEVNRLAAEIYRLENKMQHGKAGAEIISLREKIRQLEKAKKDPTELENQVRKLELKQSELEKTMVTQEVKEKLDNLDSSIQDQQATENQMAGGISDQSFATEAEAIDQKRSEVKTEAGLEIKKQAKITKKDLERLEAEINEQRLAIKAAEKTGVESKVLEAEDRLRKTEVLVNYQKEKLGVSDEAIALEKQIKKIRAEIKQAEKEQSESKVVAAEDKLRAVEQDINSKKEQLQSINDRERSFLAGKPKIEEPVVEEPMVEDLPTEPDVYDTFTGAAELKELKNREANGEILSNAESARISELEDMAVNPEKYQEEEEEEISAEPDREWAINFKQVLTENGPERLEIQRTNDPDLVRLKIGRGDWKLVDKDEIEELEAVSRAIKSREALAAARPVKKSSLVVSFFKNLFRRKK